MSNSPPVPPAPPTLPCPSSAAPTPKYKLGVLLVHGIGMQPSGDTLHRFGQVLSDRIEDVLAGTGDEVRFVEAQTSSGKPGAGAPTYAILEIGRPTGAPVLWKLTESWWAEDFRMPALSEVVRWGVQILPWTLMTHFATRIDHAHKRKEYAQLDKEVTGKTITIEWLFAVNRAHLLNPLALLAAALALPVAIVVLLLLVLLAILPIKALRSTVIKVQGVMTGTVGDSFVLVDQSIQREAILGRVRRDYIRLAAECESVAIVAHSQGAAIAHMTVKKLETDLPKWQARYAAEVAESQRSGTHAESSPPPPIPRLLITFGSGLNKLHRLRGIQQTRHLVAGWVALAGIIGFVAYGIIGGIAVAGGGGSALGLLASLATLIVFGISAFYSTQRDRGAVPESWGQRLIAACKDAGSRARVVIMERKYAGWLGAVSIVLAAVWVGTEAPGRGGWTVIFPLLTGAVFLTALWRTSFRPEPDELKLRTNWVDLYTKVDPVPNGPPLWGSTAKATEIANYGSILADHTGYWSNRDSFVSRVLAELSEPGGVDLHLGEAHLRHVTGRRIWRVGWRRQVGWFAKLAVVASLVAWPAAVGIEGSFVPFSNRLYGWFEGTLELGLGAVMNALPDWLVSSSATPPPALIGASAVAVLIFATYLVLSLAWLGWESFEVGQVRRAPVNAGRAENLRFAPFGPLFCLFVLLLAVSYILGLMALLGQLRNGLTWAPIAAAAAGALALTAVSLAVDLALRRATPSVQLLATVVRRTSVAIVALLPFTFHVDAQGSSSSIIGLWADGIAGIGASATSVADWALGGTPAPAPHVWLALLATVGVLTLMGTLWRWSRSPRLLAEWDYFSYSEPRPGLPGQLEQLVLLAVLQLGDAAYAIDVRRRISRESERDVREMRRCEPMSRDRVPDPE